MSKSLRSLTKNEQMSESLIFLSESLIFLSESLIRSFLVSKSLGNQMSEFPALARDQPPNIICHNRHVSLASIFKDSLNICSISLHESRSSVVHGWQELFVTCKDLFVRQPFFTSIYLQLLFEPFSLLVHHSNILGGLAHV